MNKSELLDWLHPECGAELEATFTNNVANAILASIPREECQQEIDKATEAYEDALDGVLYEKVDKHYADEEDSSVA